jgi:hypothetical protein
MGDQMKSLRINSQAKRIKVNDSGEFITLNFGDQRFIPELLALMEELNSAQPGNIARSAEIDAMPEGTREESLAKIAASAAFNLELCTRMKCRVDEIFRDDVCRKVFGDVVPSLDAFYEFFDQLGEVIRGFKRELDEDLQKRIGRYTDKYTKR